MTTTTTRAAQRGARNRRNGAETERRVARWLRDHGWPNADRAVATGWRAGERHRDDTGDITGTPAIVWQIKHTTHLTDTQLTRAMRDTEDQALAAGADHGILVQRRAGTTNPAEWFTWWTAADLIAAVIPDTARPLRADLTTMPLRMTLTDIATILRTAGYGDTTEVTA